MALKLELQRKGRKYLSLYLGLGHGVSVLWGLGFRDVIWWSRAFGGWKNKHQSRNSLPSAPTPMYTLALAIPLPFQLMGAYSGLQGLDFTGSAFRDVG